jgi:hypothetical protein
MVSEVIDRDEIARLAFSLEVGASVGEEVVGAVVDEDLEVVVKRVVVLLDESIARILNVPGEVLDDESVVAEASLLVVWVLAVVGLVKGGNQLRCVGLAGEEGLLLEKGDDAGGLLLQQINYGLVVAESYDIDGDALLGVQFLLQHEYLLVELLLELFVGKVDAQLREGVILHDFKSENVKDADESLGGERGGVGVRCIRYIDFFNQPGKEIAVDVLDEGVDTLF